ncbi:fluoride efflux transporter FluC [Knoellia sp. LjRoot47]|uniref:fluoride efflux transporter FluC n=1 Tax=Knoellia sp. LjRoot47 TaxID=3342330 RepID=UPI003ECEABC1
MSSPAAQPDATLLLGIAAGGVVGSLGRYAVGLALPHPAGSFPWSTLVVNLSGALAMGLLVAFLLGRPGAHRLARPVVGVGMLGGWTTFSAFAVDVVTLLETGHGGEAGAYVLASFLGGVLAVTLGSTAGQRIWRLSA